MTPQFSVRNEGTVANLRKALGKICSFTAVLFSLSFAGCSRQSDSAEVTQHAQARPPQAPSYIIRRPVPGRPNSGSLPEEALRVSENVESKLPIYTIRMEQDDLEMMDMNPYGQELHAATFVANGVVYENVKIRYRGAWARTWPKKPLKLFFNEDKLFNGSRRLNLNSGWRDTSFIRETLAYHIYAACGSPASTSRLVRVHLNNHFRGLYVEVEQPDKEFLNRRNLKGATIFKATSRMKQGDERDLGPIQAYRMHYEQETQKDEPDSFEQLRSFCAELERATDALDFFNRRVDLEKFVNYLAASVITQNWDWYNKNHFLVYDRKDSKKWFMLPWDLDRTLGDHWDWSFGNATLPVELGTRNTPGVTGWNRMMDRFCSHPDLRARLADRIQELLEKEFIPEKLFPIIDKMASDIAPEAALDRQLWPVSDPDVQGAIGVVKAYIKDRKAFLLKDLARFRSASSTSSEQRRF